MALAAASEPGAHYKITLNAGYLRAELHSGNTENETQMFLSTVAGAGKVLHCGRFFISVDSSIPMSMPEKSDFFSHLTQLGTAPTHKIAVLGDALRAGYANERIEWLVRQYGANIRGFANEETAIRWVSDRRDGRDRRDEQGRAPGQDRRRGEDRRLLQDRRRTESSV